MDQAKTRHWSNPYHPYGSTAQKQSYYGSSFGDQAGHTEICSDSASISSVNSCITHSTVMSNLNGGNNHKVEQRQPYPSINEAYRNQTPILQHQYTEKSETPRLQMFMPTPLTPRQIENMKLETEHMNINARLDPKALKRKQAAMITRLKLQQAKLVKKTETSRRKKKVTRDNVRYLETVDGVDNHNEIKMEEAAKMRAVWMVSDPTYKFDNKAGLAAWDKWDIMSKHRTQSTRMGPFA